jgi:hypothetical protein
LDRLSFVEETDIQTFSNGNGIEIRTYKNSFPPEVIVERAKSRLGEDSYSVFNNNCEHFCLWCITGEHTSAQVDRATWVSASTLGQLVGLGVRAVVAAAGPVAGLSGAGIMSGLATAGAVVGGGVVAGIGVLGGLPGAATASLLNKTVLADNPTLEVPEKNARSTGRKMSYVGAGTGTVGSIAAVGAAGVTTGFSAAGITSGLAAIGGMVGGGMAAGVFVATAAPVAAAGIVGYGAYKLRKLFSGKKSDEHEKIESKPE